MSPERKASNKLIKNWARFIKGNVLSVGSGTDDDGTGRAYRTYFTEANSYTTSEPFENEYCDLVLDVRDMGSIDTASFDAVFCYCVLEHVDDFAAGFRECCRVLKSGGKLILGLPFMQKMHKVPQDFWRFTEYAIRYQLDLNGMTVEKLVPLGGEQWAPVTYMVRAKRGDEATRKQLALEEGVFQ